MGKEIVIVEICKKDFAEDILKDESGYWILAMMPCGFAVCKQSEGIIVYMVSMDVFARMIGGDIGRTLSAVFEDERVTLNEITC